MASKHHHGPLSPDGKYRWNGMEWVAVKPRKAASRLRSIQVWRLALVALMLGGLIAAVLTG